MFILGEPGMGKSSIVRRMVLGLTGRGVTPLILGDLKPDYAALVRALGGQVISVGPGRDRINPLDVGPWTQLHAQVSGKTAQQVRSSVVDRRTHMVTALISLVRKGRTTADEDTVIAAALRHLAAEEAQHGNQPVLSEVLRTIQNAPDAVREVTLFAGAGQEPRYQEATGPLQAALLALLNGALGDTFNGPTTSPIDLDTPAVCVDISGIDENDHLRTAATLLSTWSYGFGSIDAAHLLADEGVAPKRTFFTVLDEMWRVLRVGSGLIDRADALTRLNRQKGTGIAYITHGLADLEALPTEEDRAKARGFADRSAVLMAAASTEAELSAISKVRPLSDAEASEVLSWTAPESWSGTAAEASAGLGNFLIKVGSRPGIPVHLSLTEPELRLGNTDARWDIETARQGAAA
ncbi:ATP/GTP-binding protein [Natronoglycomyces albus]|uniref:ATP/GTP-binding protein n=1 Tax=Natronoglycomyces albus TaxID=2811108 RepID=UPI0031B6336F